MRWLICLPAYTHGGWSTGQSWRISPAVFWCIILHRKLVVCNLIQTILFEKCNIQFLPCTLLLQFLMYCYFLNNKKYISIVWSTLASLALPHIKSWLRACIVTSSTSQSITRDLGRFPFTEKFRKFCWKFPWSWKRVPFDKSSSCSQAALPGSILARFCAPKLKIWPQIAWNWWSL